MKHLPVKFFADSIALYLVSFGGVGVLELLETFRVFLSKTGVFCFEVREIGFPVSALVFFLATLVDLTQFGDAFGNKLLIKLLTKGRRIERESK